MFENFSFEPSRRVSSVDAPPAPSPLTPNFPLLVEDSIEMVSPFSSRCASPFHGAAPPRRFPTSQPRQLSITSLTNKLNAHSLYTSSNPPLDAHAYGSSDEDPGIDEGYSEGESGSDSLLTPPLSAMDSPTYFDVDISSFPPTPTSAPSQSMNTLFSLTRRNRAALTRLQCSANSALHLQMLIEEQHPSCLPLTSLESPTSIDISPERRRASVASIGKRKIEKAKSRKGSVASLKALESSAGVGKAMVKRGVRLRRSTGGSVSGAGRR